MARIKRSGLAIVFILGMLLISAPCKAGESLFSIGLAGSVGTSPYKSYDPQWTPVPLISYESDHFYIRGLTGGIKLFTNEFLELSVFAGYDPTSFDPDDSDDRAVRRLNSRWSSAVAGGEARVMTPYGDLYANVAADLLGHSDGLIGAFGYGYSIEAGPVELSLDAGARWANANYNDYYYGVSRKESSKSGLSKYDAGAGLSPYIGLGISAPVSEHWTVFCKGEVVFLSDAIKDSPMVDESSTQSLTLGAIYSF